MSKEWYRCEEWTNEERTEFENRFKKARKNSRVQYLKIQGLTLLGTEKRELWNNAFELFDRALSISSKDEFFLGDIYNGMAEYFKRIGNTQKAIEFYRKTLKREKEKPSIISNVRYDFPVFIIENELIDYYDEAMEIFNTYQMDSPFPISVFSFHAVKAAIYYQFGKLVDAKVEAQIAFDASKQLAPFKYHSKLGLVTNTDRPLYRKMTEILNK
jgi:tetratricopeptide (TPR) repeat protein